MLGPSHCHCFFYDGMREVPTVSGSLCGSRGKLLLLKPLPLNTTEASCLWAESNGSKGCKLPTPTLDHGNGYQVILQKVHSA